MASVSKFTEQSVRYLARAEAVMKAARDQLVDEGISDLAIAWAAFDKGVATSVSLKLPMDQVDLIFSAMRTYMNNYEDYGTSPSSERKVS